jgi:hypothetical protein
MSLGTLGSTLNDELNRLANGGTYRDSAAMVDEALAAKQWANRENISPYSTDTVGVLNEIAGLGLDKKNWLDFNGVCNYIAGTSGLPAAAALRQIYPTTDLLTGVAAYYVDAIDASASGQTITNLGNAGSLLPTTLGSTTSADSNDPIFLAHTGTNYVYLPGASGNYISTPDAAALDITGDIDIRLQLALDDWTPVSTLQILTKESSSTTRSYRLSVLSTGGIQLIWSVDGSATIALSSVNPGIADGAIKWIRVTLDVNNGAGGYDFKFFTSDDGTTWTQLGTTQTGVGTTSIFNSTSPVEIGTRNFGVNEPLAGKVYRAQIFASVDGTDKRLDADTSVITAGSATSFTALTGQTMTINRSTSGRKTVAVTQPTWLFGTDDYMEVNNRYMAHSTSAENYVYLSGASGNYMSVADNPPLDITTDLDLQVQVALDDWTPAANSALLYKWDNAGSSAAYGLRVNATTGRLILLWTENGSTVKSATSSVSPTVTDGSTLWVRATLDVDNGAGGNDVIFYTSTNGTTWTQLGTTVTTAGVTSIFSGTGQVEIGGFAGGLSPSKGKFFRAIIKNGIDGTIVLDADASVITLPSQTTFVDRSSNAYTVTINKSGVGTFVSTGNYLYLPGVTSNYASAPDAAALDITGDLDLRVKVALDDWTPSTANTLLGKWATGQLSYDLEIGIDGKVYFYWTTNGSTAITKTSSVATGITDGSTKWIRATLDVDNGASGNDVIFYTSDDGITWTQLGTTQTTAGVTSIYSGTAILAVGSNSQGGGVSRGKFFRAQVLNGINGTVAFDANFENSITSLLQTSFTESSTNGATVTINRSGSTFRSAGVIDAGYLYPGATNTFSNSTTDFLNFGATDSFSVLAVVRQWNTPVNGGMYISKRDGGSVNVGYEVYPITSNTQYLVLDDGPNSGFSSFTNATIGSLLSDVGIVNRTTQTTTFYINATTNTSPTSISTLGSLSNIGALSIGRRPAGSSGAGGLYQDFELIGAAVFRTVLTAAQIRQIVNYFANREAYL